MVRRLRDGGQSMNILSYFWSAPFFSLLNISFRTNEIRGVTTVRASHQWCAINLLGKQSCGLENISKANDLLRDLKNDFEENS